MQGRAESFCQQLVTELNWKGTPQAQASLWVPETWGHSCLPSHMTQQIRTSQMLQSLMQEQ